MKCGIEKIKDCCEGIRGPEDSVGGWVISKTLKVLTNREVYGEWQNCAISYYAKALLFEQGQKEFYVI